MDSATIAFKQQFRPGHRYTEGDRINSSILRAMKKGKLSKAAARNCMHDWPAMRAARAKAVVWHTVAIAELARVAGHAPKKSRLSRRLTWRVIIR